ncbi:MAG: hypothetical protein ABI823_12890 [Bryobacteraceae bacterium]
MYAVHPVTSKRKRRSRGTILILFALVFAVLAGATALVLDVGWGYFVARRAQTAVDAGAMAAVAEAVQTAAANVTPSCGTVGCQSAGACPTSGNLSVACKYARQAGFVDGGDSGRQTVAISAGAGPSVPGVPYLNADYWVQVTASQRLAPWLGGIIGSAGLNPTAQAIAAVRRSNVNMSIDLLNRSKDCFVSLIGLGLVCGEDLLTLGLNSIQAENGIHMASSNPDGLGLPAIATATVVLSANVQAPYTRIMGKGAIQNIGLASWTTPPQNGFPDGEMFSDPMQGMGQPPAPTGLPDHPVSGGIIVGSLNPAAPTVLPPGNYYATTIALPLLPAIPTGLPVTVLGNVIFSDGNANPCGGFCNYVFYGGIVTGALSTTTFAPGRYIFAGSQPVAGGPGTSLTVGANAIMKDLTPLVNGEITQNTDAGEIFIFTDSHFPGLQLPVSIASSGISFPQARAGLMAGVNPQITLHGLNGNHQSVPANLRPFAPVLIWQDQANTTLKYTPQGKVDISCGNVCNNILSIPGSQEMVLQASQSGGHAGTNLYGTIYGPRGSYLTLLGLLPGDTIAGPLQIITGALQMTLNTSLKLKALPNPPTRLTAVLIN